MTAPKFSSSGKAELYVIPPVIEQSRGLSTSSVVIRNVLSSACLSGGGITQWLDSLSWHPWGYRDLVRGW